MANALSFTEFLQAFINVLPEIQLSHNIRNGYALWELFNQHFFFFTKRKPVLKEKLGNISVKVFTEGKKVVKEVIKY
jgi:hypothetical protein